MPPRRRVDEVSTWLKGRKRWSSLSAGIPIPVSLTAKKRRATRRGEPESICSPRAQETSSDTPPRSVNLRALPMRLVRIWRIRGSSLFTISGTPASTFRSRASASDRAFGAKKPERSWTHARREKGACSISILPVLVLTTISRGGRPLSTNITLSSPIGCAV